MATSVVRDIFINNENIDCDEFGKVHGDTFKTGFFGSMFIQTIVKKITSKNHEKFKTDISEPQDKNQWETYKDIDKQFIYPLLLAYNIYSPYISILIYNELKQHQLCAARDVGFEIDLTWVPNTQKQVLDLELHVWEKLTTHHTRKNRIA